MHHAITIDALKVLDAIDRRGSFAGAASELFRVPSAISYTVQKLEEDLDVALFDRSGHRAVLTPAGRYLLEEGRTLLEAAETLAHNTKQVAQGWETRLKIAFNSLLPAEALFPAIEAFQALGVPVEIQLIEEVFAGAWDALQCRRADLVVGADQMTQPAGQFATLPLGEMHFVYTVAANHPLTSAQQPLEDDVIADYPAAVAADSSRHLQPGTAGIFSRQRTLTVSNLDQKIALQKAGLGVGWLPASRIQRELATGELIALEVKAPRRPVTLQMARYREDKGKALMWFWDTLSRPGTFDRWLSKQA
ncbi:MAG: LysR family transcriptional regulator [Marinobacter sp.]|nr:LysR family transcriptional regulator [Marinobacter sp.]